MCDPASIRWSGRRSWTSCRLRGPAAPVRTWSQHSRHNSPFPYSPLRQRPSVPDRGPDRPPGPGPGDPGGAHPPGPVPPGAGVMPPARNCRTQMSTDGTGCVPWKGKFRLVCSLSDQVTDVCCFQHAFAKRSVLTCASVSVSYEAGAATRRGQFHRAGQSSLGPAR